MTIEDSKKLKKIAFSIYKYCSIDLSNYPKLDSYTIESYHDGIIIISNNNTKLKGIRYIDSSIKIDEIYDSIYKVNNSMFLGCQNGSERLIDRKGNTILDIKKNKYYGYKEGYIIVHDDFFNKGVIDIKGNEILKCNYRDIDYTQSGFIVRKNYDVGVVDFFGKEIIKASYNSINYKDGFYIVYNKKAKYGLKNSKGKNVLKEKYNYIMPFNENLICVNDDNIVYIYTHNKKIIYQFDTKEYYIYRYDNEIISFRNINKRHHIIFYNLEPVVIECDFMSKYINDIAYIKKDDKYYLVNHKGKTITDEYDKAYIKNEKIMLEKDNQLFYVDSDNSIKKIVNTWNRYSNSIILDESKDLVILNDSISSTCKFIFSNGKIIDTKEEYNYAYIVGDYIILINNTKKFLNSLYTKNGEKLVPQIEDRIYVIDKNKVVINNHIIDLSVEYLNFDIKYNLLIENKYNKIIKQFTDINKREEYINEIMKYQSNLNKEIEYMENRIKELEKIDLDFIDNKIIKKKKSN